MLQSSRFLTLGTNTKKYPLAKPWEYAEQNEAMCDFFSIGQTITFFESVVFCFFEEGNVTAVVRLGAVLC